MKPGRNYINIFLSACRRLAAALGVLSVAACQKELNINIPPGQIQVVVDGSIENGVPPIILLSKSQQFFNNPNVNNLGAYFIHGARVKVTGSDGTSSQLSEFCLQDLNLPAAQTEALLSDLGYSSIDSISATNVCAYTVPDIVTYYLTGTCSFMGKVKTTYSLDIMSPPIVSGQKDSIHVTASTTIPAIVPIDSLVVRPDPDKITADSMSSIYVYLTVPDTFGSYIRFWTKIDSEPFYTAFGGSVYDDQMFVGRTYAFPLERGQSPDAVYNVNTDFYYWKGDTVTVKWSNIDGHTYLFFYTLENDGGASPFSSPVQTVGNVTNGFGVWAGYGTAYYTIVVPKN